MATYTYPAPPAAAHDDILKPGAVFRREVVKVAASLVLFIGLYLLLLGCSIALAAALCVIGLFTVMHIHNLWAIIFGLGIVGIGLMVVFFVIKFLFARKKEDNSDRLEITEEAYPDLFAFIRSVSEETGTRFPAHIYLSAEVNAYVFFNSGFWSMFLPVRKNLVIGLGLVNMINLSEFKAVIAHEFGHFSQKSMRAGSYVYHANKVLYNLLYEHKGYSDVLQRWAGVHAIFAFCANVTVKIVQAIQWLLQQAYRLVNRRYLSLSRQMEFHADAVAARSAGANNAIHALRRIELADVCYQAVIEKYNEWLPEQLKGENLYSHQRITARFIAADHELPLSVQGLPLMHSAEKHYKSYRRIKVGDQWASHPSREQREVALDALQVEAGVVEDAVWTLFPDELQLQQSFTGRLYEKVSFEGPASLLQDALFTHKYEAAAASYALPAFYQGYYDNRSIAAFDTDAPVLLTTTITDMDTFFRQQEALPARIRAMAADLELLDQIIDKRNGVRTFDADGIRYRQSGAAGLSTAMTAELDDLKAQQLRQDMAVYHHCLTLAPDPAAAASLKQYYKASFQLQVIVQDNLSFCNNLAPLIQSFRGGMPLQEAQRLSRQVAESVQLFARRLERVDREMAAVAQLRPFTRPDSLAGIGQGNWEIINEQHQIDTDKLNALWEHLQTYVRWGARTGFELQRQLLELQLRILKPELAAAGALAG